MADTSIKREPIFSFPPRVNATQQTVAPQSASLPALPSKVENVKIIPHPRFGQQLQFDGSTSRICLGPLAGTLTVTVSVWIKKNESGWLPGRAPTNPIVSVDWQQFNDYVAPCCLDLPYGSTLGGLKKRKDTPLSSGWHHVAIVLDCKQQRSFLDGELYDESVFMNETHFKQTTVWIGYWGQNVGQYKAFFIGSMARLEVFSGALSHDEIRQLSKPATPTPILHATLGSWNYDKQRNESQLVDVAGNALACTVVGQPNLIDDAIFAKSLQYPSDISINNVLLPKYCTLMIWCRFSPAPVPGRPWELPICLAAEVKSGDRPAHVPGPTREIWAEKLDVWNHYALVYYDPRDEDDLYLCRKLYTNGEPGKMEQGQLTWTPAQGQVRLRSGTLGGLAHLMIFDVALTAEQIRSVMEQTRRLPLGASTVPARQRTLTLGGKAKKTGVMAATAGKEFANVRADIYVRGATPRPDLGKSTFVVIDGWSLGQFVLPGGGSDSWVLCKRDVDLTAYVEGLFTVDVEALNADADFEVELRYDVVERPATRKQILTLGTTESKTISAGPDALFLSGRADIYLRAVDQSSRLGVDLRSRKPLWGVGKWQLSELQGWSEEPAGVWLLIGKDFDLTPMLEWADKVDVWTAGGLGFEPGVEFRLRLRLDLVSRTHTWTRGVALLSGNDQTTTIRARFESGSPVEVIRAAKLKLSVRGNFIRRGEWVDVYVAGHSVGPFWGTPTGSESDWQVVADLAPPSLMTRVDGTSSFEVFAHASGQGTWWELKVEWEIATVPGTATKVAPRAVVVDVKPGTLAQKFAGPGPCRVIFRAAPNQTLSLGIWRAKGEWTSQVPQHLSVTVSASPGNTRTLKLTGGAFQEDLTALGWDRKWVLELTPGHSTAMWEIPGELDVKTDLAFAWQSVPLLSQRVTAMQADSEAIRSRLASLERKLATTIDILEYAKKIRDALAKLEAGLKTASDALGVAELIPPIRTGAQQFRNVVKRSHDSVKAAQRVAESIETVVTPIRETLVKVKRWDARLVLICDRMIVVEVRTVHVVGAAKDCVEAGGFTDGKLTAAQALEKICTDLLPVVQVVADGQRKILEPVERMEKALDDLRDRLAVLADIHVTIGSIINLLEPVLNVLREIDGKLSYEILGVSIRTILKSVEALLDKALDVLRPITDRLKFDIKLDIPGLGSLDGLVNISLDAKFEIGAVELDTFSVKWQTDFSEVEKQVKPILEGYLKCCGHPLAWELFPAPLRYVGGRQSLSMDTIDDPAILFDDTNYGGTRQVLAVGWHDVGALTIGSDRVSSLRVDTDFRVTLFEHDGFHGSSMQFTGDQPSLVSAGLNDRASSVIVEKLSDPKTHIPALLFEDASYAGNCQVLRVGWHDTGALRVNDRVSSLKLAAGVRVSLFEHDGFCGSYKQFTSEDPRLVDRGFNDRASSVIVEILSDESTHIPVMLFENGNYAGNCQALRVGWHDVGALRVGNDRVSSLRVAPGYRVWLFEHDGFHGSFRRFTSDERDLVNAGVGGFDNRASSVIVEKLSDMTTHIPLVVFDQPNWSGNCQAFAVGSHDLGALKIGNDRISSIELGGHYYATLYADAGLRGESSGEYMNQSLQRAGFQLGTFDKKTSSIKVIRWL